MVSPKAAVKVRANSTVSPEGPADAGLAFALTHMTGRTSGFHTGYG